MPLTFFYTVRVAKVFEDVLENHQSVKSIDSFENIVNYYIKQRKKWPLIITSKFRFYRTFVDIILRPRNMFQHIYQYMINNRCLFRFSIWIFSVDNIKVMAILCLTSLNRLKNITKQENKVQKNSNHFYSKPLRHMLPTNS